MSNDQGDTPSIGEEEERNYHDWTSDYQASEPESEPDYIPPPETLDYYSAGGGGLEEDFVEEDFVDEVAEQMYASRFAMGSTQEEKNHSTELNFDAVVAYMAPPDMVFCSLKAIVNYPGMYIGKQNKERVNNEFFDKGKIYEREWHFFYLHTHIQNKFILVVPTFEVERFLGEINQKLGTKLTIPDGPAAKVFRVGFPGDGTPRPRYLGVSTNSKAANGMKTAPVPHARYMPDKHVVMCEATETAIANFNKKLGDLLAAEKKGGRFFNNSKENKKAKQDLQRQIVGDKLTSVQRFLGLVKYEELEISGEAWGDEAGDPSSRRRIIYSADINLNEPPPSPMADDVVFVCVDVEANEHAQSQITEVGVATLDTRDIASVAPGEGGQNWFPMIRARHFRIKEYAHVRNNTWVNGCPEKFEFGESEWLTLSDAPQVIASCFKPPYSGSNEMEEKRKVVFVGHDAQADVQYLRKLGYDVMNLPPHCIIDTAELFKYYRKDQSTRGLGGILSHLGIDAWYLHNAGNDAYRTVQAMIGVTIMAILGDIDTDRLKSVEPSQEVNDWAQPTGDSPSREASNDTSNHLPGSSSGQNGNAPENSIANEQDDEMIAEIALAALALITAKNDEHLVKELARQASKDSRLHDIMMKIVDKKATESQRAEFLLRVENTERMLLWEQGNDGW